VPGLSNVVEVESPDLTLAPGQTTLDVGGYGWRAQCPTAMHVIGTSFGAGIGNQDYVKSYGTFVSGFAHNDSNITTSGFYVQAICANVASTGAPRAARVTSRTDDARAEMSAARTDMRAAQAAVNR
jgi:hypothetical protein